MLKHFFKLTIEDFAKKLAARTPGMAGADLANVTNEGALMAARAGKKRIDFSDFNKVFFKNSKNILNLNI